MTATAEKQDKASSNVKYKLNLLKKIDLEKPKFEVARESLSQNGTHCLTF